MTIILSHIVLIITSIALLQNCAALESQYSHGGGCDPGERAALISFRKAITSDPANRLASWHGGDCCRWRGVSCSNKTGHVLRLQLRNPNLYMDSGCYSKTDLFGEISPSLLSLKQLKYMDLSINCLTGPRGHIPLFLGSMNNLRYLNLSGIPFIGTVPPQLGNLSKLQYLDVGMLYQTSRMMYSADITWLTKFLSLKYLSFSGIDMSGTSGWAHILNMIPSLRVIRLHDCSLHSANQSLQYLNLTKLMKLDLSLNDFNQQISSSWFWNATSLKYLILHSSNLFGELPDTIGNIASLSTLDLSYNDVLIARNLKNYICNLEILDLRGNSIKGDITELLERLPQCTWKNLRELHFRENMITGTLPKFSGNFTSLRILDLNSNNLSGSVPTKIGVLSNLTSLDLSNNSFSGVVTEEHFAGLTSLKYLDMSFNNLKINVDGEWSPPFMLESAYFTFCNMGPLFPAWLLRHRRITTLDISSTFIVGNIPERFWSVFSKAEYLDISGNQLTGNLPAHFDHMAFRVLNLSSNQLTGPITTIPRNILALDISNNSFSGTLPSKMEAPELITLLMFSNHIAGSIPESICKSQMLQDLDLSSNHLEGHFPNCRESKSIRFLLLSNNNLSGTLPALLQNCTDLEFLDLAWNKLSGRLPTWVGELTHLQFLRLSHNTFSGNIPVQMTDLSYLHFLDLSDNYLSGGIPPQLSNLTGMTSKRLDPSITSYTVIGTRFIAAASRFGEILSVITKGQHLRFGGTLGYFVSIDLSSNYLTGEIPSDITSLDALINLNLSSNCLIGKIPIQIGVLHALESLDLSMNKLFGEIPSGLSNLTSLSYLNLSYNNLSGRIPSGRQLDTLSADNPSNMYIGNSGLCGPPLQTNCSETGTFIHGYQMNNRKEVEPSSFCLGLGLGFVMGLWIVFCAMLFRKTWRTAYFRHFDKIYDNFFLKRLYDRIYALLATK